MKRFVMVAGVVFFLGLQAQGASFSAQKIDDLNEVARARDGGQLTPEMRRYFTIQSASVKLVDDRVYPNGLHKMRGLPALKDPTEPPAGGVLGEANVFIDQLINLGKKLWNIVEANRPVVSFADQTASALPRGIESWSELEGWDNPRAKTYHLTYKNVYGTSVVDFAYRIVYVAGGSYKGQGKYLAQVTVYPETVSVAWGYTFDAKVSIPVIMNHGTREAPIAGAEVLVDWTIETPLKSSRSTSSYAVRGDGQLLAL